MAYPNETSILKIPYPSAASESSATSEHAQALAIEDPLVLALKALAGVDLNCTFSSGFAVSAGAGLSISVAAGLGLIGGLTIESLAATAHAALPDNTAIIYIYLQATATTKADNGFTVEHSTDAPPRASSILIAIVTTAAGAVTVLNNTPSGRAPRIPATVPGIPTLRVVAPAGAEYSSPKTAIEACNAGDIVWIMAGTYTLTATITLPANNITILGANQSACILNNTTGSAQNVINLNGKTGVRIECLTIQTAALNTGIHITGSGCTDTKIFRVCFVSVAKVKFVNLGASDCARSSILLCRFSGLCGDVAIQMHATGGIVAECDLAITDMNADSVVIHIETYPHQAIIDNRLKITAAAVTGSGIYARNAPLARVRGNVIEYLTPPAEWFEAIHVLNTSAATYNVGIIAGNIIQIADDKGQGIFLNSSGAGLLMDAVITANLVLDALYGVRIYAAGVQQTRVHDNEVRTCTNGITDAGTDTNAVDNA